MRAVDIVHKHCRRANDVYVQAFENGDGDLSRYDVYRSRLRVAHFLTQCFHETGDLTILTESLNYSAQRIPQVWPSRPEAVRFAGDPRGLANCVYGGRMGNSGPNDGWLYIGRGLIQCTGLESYDYFGKRLGIDLVGNPALAIDPKWTLRIALEEWAQKGCNELADKNDLVGIRRRINGGLIGIDDARQEFASIWPDLASQSDAIFQQVFATVAPGQEAWKVAAPDHSTVTLQNALNTLLGLHLTADGLAGPATRDAVKTFQAAHGLAADGLAGSDTWKALDSALGKAA